MINLVDPHMEDKENYELNMLKSIHPEKKNTLNSSQQELKQEDWTAVLYDEQQASTRMIRSAEAKIHKYSYYQLHSKILENSPITESVRARLRSFLMNEAAKQSYLRETYALACNLIDLYLSKKGMIKLQDFQDFAISCLIVAGKIKEDKFPCISFTIFKKETLLLFQQRLISKLEFQLNPPSYIDLTEKTVILWDSFTASQKLYNYAISEQAKGVNFKLRRIYQQLDCIFMLLKSLDYDLEDLILNLFFLNLRILHVSPDEKPSKLKQSEFLQRFYVQDHFTTFYYKFLNYYGKLPSTINPQIGCFIRFFLEAETSQPQWKFSTANTPLQILRIWDKFQSLTQSPYKLYKIVKSKLHQQLN